MKHVLLVALLLAACSTEPRRSTAPGTSQATDGSIADGATADGATVDAATMDAGTLRDTGPSGNPDASAPPPSCPTLDRSGITTVRSGGMDRKVAFIFPAAKPASMPVVFTFHGLTTLDMMPVENMISGFGLQVAADREGVVFVVPEALPRSLPGVGTVAMWGIMNDEAVDLALFDDTLACLDSGLTVDRDRVTAWGHSGGALWTSALLMNRSDQLAAVAEMSGGTDYSLPLLGSFLSYHTPSSPIPALLMTGGMNDVWPEQFALIRFEMTTDSLQAGLRLDGHLVIRCRHELGHFQIPPRGWTLVLDWLLDHTRGQTSAFLPDGLTGHADWCEQVQ